jgi:hypothetical protein
MFIFKIFELFSYFLNGENVVDIDIINNVEVWFSTTGKWLILSLIFFVISTTFSLTALSSSAFFKYSSMIGREEICKGITMSHIR